MKCCCGRWMNRWRRAWPVLPVGLLVLGALAGGCSGPATPAKPDYATVGTDPHRNTAQAIQENQRGLALLNEGKLEEAQKAFKAALAADVMYGPAHNNLGKVYFAGRQWYLAAWEFEYAGKLMPQRAEPKNNLGLVYETVGKITPAVEVYEQALKLEPDNPELAGNLARARYRRGDRDASLKALLGQIALQDPRRPWADWAREKLATYRETPATAPASVIPIPTPVTTGPARP